jgi:hypothetical protein
MVKKLAGDDGFLIIEVTLRWRDVNALSNDNNACVNIEIEFICSK